MGLKWGDIDFNRAVININRIQVLKKGTNILEFGHPKTAKSRREITMPEMLKNELEIHKSQQEKNKEEYGDYYQDDDLVLCCNDCGIPFKNSSIGSNFRSMARKAGYPISFHDLRHIHASLLLKAGEHPKVVSERLGHSQIGITLDIYSHVMPGMQKETAKKIDNLLANE
ncbi:Transposase [Pelotomaculum schinkii]|uniref:Transposase n=1 Tax=Pelotomaculum schinkii TaxID=78350 RepID=A0A4Y7RDY5_9FIRM|nr:site-specific integrase [Pelotomaculum schinkii]TEB06983.1 Transposase [Pelotomaculum schinkii]